MTCSGRPNDRTFRVAAVSPTLPLVEAVALVFIDYPLHYLLAGLDPRGIDHSLRQRREVVDLRPAFLNGKGFLRRTDELACQSRDASC